MIDHTYPAPVAQLLTLGEPDPDDWPDYLAYGLEPEHIPDLIQMLEDQELRFSDELDPEYLTAAWAPVQAWRALGQLKAEAAIPALIGQLYHVDEDDDEWFSEEAPLVFAQIGPAAIQPLAEYLRQGRGEEDLFALATASNSLQVIANTYPDEHERCGAAILAALENYEQNTAEYNAFLIVDLMELDVIESAPLVESAFKAGKVDPSIFGDFQDYQVEMGLISERTSPRARPAGLGLPRLQEPAAQPKPKSKDSKKEKNKRKQAKKSRRQNRKK